ncbi:MAG: prepilin peptidase [bacterium]|nr:prepilin peptidase [bacterium]
MDIEPFVLISFLFGAVIGSFLNVVVFRYHTGMTFFGRSLCLYCGKELRFYEMIPVLSFLFLRGRCASCQSRLSWQYPLVELSTAIFFAIVYAYAAGLYGGVPLALFTLYLFAAAALLVIIAAYDLRHMVIPDGMVYLFALLALARPFFFPIGGETLSSALLAGPALALPFALFYFLSGGRWMGLGDAKLALGLGWLLGAAGSVMAFLFAFWTGAAVAAVLLFLRGRRFTMKSEIPFAPFLVLGTGIALLVPPDFLFPSLSLFFLGLW